jgi:hypothetical protein
MAEQSKKFKHGLDETLLLITGAQILLGFEYRAVLEKGFENLPQTTQYLKIGSLGLLLLTVCLLLLVPAYHLITCRGEPTIACSRFINKTSGAALLPFALALGLDFFSAVQKTTGTLVAVILGGIAVLMALFFWYGLEFIQKARGKGVKNQPMKRQEDQQQGEGGAKLAEKIEHVLTEARVVLPGVQALLGFQLAAYLMEGFDKLPTSSKYIHLASLLLLGLSIVLLMTPAAYHRIVEEGEDSEHFRKIASRLLLWAMVPLAPALAGDFYVVLAKVTESTAFGIVGAVLIIILFYGLWFGFTYYRRKHPAHTSEPQSVKGSDRGGQALSS